MGAPASGWIRRPVVLRASVLRSIGACRAQRRIFRRRWPKGVEITAESIAEARALGLRVGWLAWHALTPEAVLEALAVDQAEGVQRALAWSGRAAERERLEAERKARQAKLEAAFGNKRAGWERALDEDDGAEGAT